MKFAPPMLLILSIVCLPGLLLLDVKSAHAVELTLPGYQSQDGMITVHFRGDQVDPYFSAKALLVAREVGVDAGKAAIAWINWVMPRQRTDGSFDRYCRRGKGFVTCEAADADDATLALWIELLVSFEPPGGMPKAWRASLRRASEHLQSLQDHRLGVYRISATQPVSLLMDNIEVYSALRALADFYSRIGDDVRSQLWRARSKLLSDAIARVFRVPGGSFRVSTQDLRTSSFYPDKVAQLFPLLAEMKYPDSDESWRYSEWMRVNRAEWFALAESDYPWALVALAAYKAGDQRTVSCWRAHAAPFRYSRHWNVLEESLYTALARGGVDDALPPCVNLD